MKRLFRYLFSTVSTNQEDARREWILDILLMGVVVLTSSVLITAIINNRFTLVRQGGPIEIVAAFTLTFWSLFFFSKAGYYRYVAYIFVAVLFVAATYVQICWGADVPQGLLLFA